MITVKFPGALLTDYRNPLIFWFKMARFEINGLGIEKEIQLQ